jgi:hypothetical protein
MVDGHAFREDSCVGDSIFAICLTKGGGIVEVRMIQNLAEINTS